MAHEPEVWTTKGFLDYFIRIHDRMQDRAFCFVLGAGASRTSGILTGAELVDDWLQELHKRFDPKQETRKFSDWTTAENLDIPQFHHEQSAEFYPEIFDRRFGEDPEEGFAYLENVMEKAEPGFGYSVLAQILTKTQHRVVVTTNFDNLVADALSVFTRTFPLVCGHELLTQFVRARMRRPLVAKIHRDWLLAPQNDPNGVSALAPGWKEALGELFHYYTPIVIGYGGNDGSLMGFLEALKPGDLVGRMIWCYRGDKPRKQIRQIVARHKGALVPILGFDELMAQLNDRLGYGLLYEEILNRAKERAETYRKQFEQLQRKVATSATAQEPPGQREDVLDALAATIRRQHNWWTWELKASMEPDLDKREEVYGKGIEEFPDSPELLGNFAVFLEEKRQKHDEAESIYRKALEIDPNKVNVICNFATFLTSDSKRHDEAERYYRRALTLDPENATTAGNFAVFLHQVRRNFDEAERYYRTSIQLDPENVATIGNFAVFLHQIRKNHVEAERFYRLALEREPYHAHIVNFTGFLLEVGRVEEASSMARKAWNMNKASPNQLAAEIAFYRALIGRLEHGDDSDAIGRIKSLLARGFSRQPGSLDGVLEATSLHLSAEDQEFYRTLTAAILDAEKTADLDRFERWNEIQPIPLDAPWPAAEEVASMTISTPDSLSKLTPSGKRRPTVKHKGQTRTTLKTGDET